MKRPAQPEEVAPAFVFFASEADSSYVTGEVLTPLGGGDRRVSALTPIPLCSHAITPLKIFSLTLTAGLRLLSGRVCHPPRHRSRAPYRDTLKTKENHLK